MLKPDDARRELASFKSAKHLKARQARAQKLPKAAAAVALGLFRLPPDGKLVGDWQQRHRLIQRSARLLGADAKLRKKVFAALYPTFCEEIERGVEVLTRLPYTTGYNRRPYRAPFRPELFATRIGAYLLSVNDTLSEIADDALTPEWVAAWAVHLGYDTSMLGYLFAGQIDAGRDEVLEILKDSAANRHAIGGPGKHAVRGLLCCQRPAAWEFVANLLLAAQKQEGLRQVILEAADEAEPQAFRTLLAITIDQNLIRFAAVARAAGVWLGEQLMVEDAKALKTALVTVRENLDDAAARAKALKSGDGMTLYRALWAIAFEDATKAVAAATPILRDKDVGRRLAAVKLLGETSLVEVADAVVPLLDDDDPRILSAVITFFSHFSPADWQADEDGDGNTTKTWHPKKLFEKLEMVIPTLPEKARSVTSPVPTWPLADISQEAAANLLYVCLQDRSAERLLPWLKMMSPQFRVASLAKLCTPRTLTNKVRATLMACASELNTTVREAALGYLKKCKLAEDEVRTLEGLLTRKHADFRRGVFELLLNRPDKAALASVERLLPGEPVQRAAGIELARRLVESEREVDRTRHLLTTFADGKGARLPEAEREAIDRILNPAAAPPSLANGLGLFDPKERSVVVPPRKLNVSPTSPASARFLKELDAFVYENRDKTFVRKTHWGTGHEVVVGSLQYAWEFPPPDPTKSVEENLATLPLKDLWFDWYAKRPASTRDADGLEVVRAMLTPTARARDGEHDAAGLLEDDGLDGSETGRQVPSAAPVKLRHREVVSALTRWFLFAHLPKNAIDFGLDTVEWAFASVPASLHEKLPPAVADGEDAEAATNEEVDWRTESGFTFEYKEMAWFTRSVHWNAEHSARYYRLARWFEEPIAGVKPMHVDLDDLLRGYDAGAATLADFYHHLIGPRGGKRHRYLSAETFDSLRALTTVGPRFEGQPGRAIYERRRELQDAVRRVVDRVLELEITRGETPNAASKAVSCINRINGVEPVFRLLAALGKADFKITYWNAGQNKPESLTKLITSIVPGPEDTPEAFAMALEPWLQSGKISHEKIVALGLVNTRLVKHVAQAIQWPGYEEACYWFMAHSTGAHAWTLQHAGGGANESEEQKTWRALVKARSELTAEQRADGVVDVAWFHKAYAALDSDERWDAVERAARYLGYGRAEKKAARLADVLLGRTTKSELVADIEKKFLKESVRLLGLLPLPAATKKRDAELADRYRVLKNYERYARGLSSLSKEPAMQSYRLGMENLAVTAGYPGPVRLEWAVTGQEVADLAKGPATVKVKDVTVTLRLGAFAEPETTQTQGGKDLKSLPKDVKADPKVEDLFERKKNLKRLASGTKRTLEESMCSGACFEPDELKLLLQHAVVRPMIEVLVLKTDGGLGYPVKGGGALRRPDGGSIPVRGSWSVAHPLDFVAAKNWHEFQAECFHEQRVQPFKQVFREVYALTPAEKEDGDKSRRYSGQQVNENQAKALLAGRGWSTKEDLSKLYRAEGLQVELFLDHGYSTPGDAAAPAVGELRFSKRGEWKPLLLKDVPAVIFSEVMRDLDLVVSVAHVGGVDPEATQSTIAMRSSLLAETCTLLKLSNVKLESKHALIKGEYGFYSVHLGSGVVHKQPGGALCVVAVNAQHRGRLFLPFADDDPRTAEVVSKVLLLARDHEIQDPTILEQIASR